MSLSFATTLWRGIHAEMCPLVEKLCPRDPKGCVPKTAKAVSPRSPARDPPRSPVPQKLCPRDSARGSSTPYCRSLSFATILWPGILAEKCPLVQRLCPRHRSNAVSPRIPHAEKCPLVERLCPRDCTNAVSPRLQMLCPQDCKCCVPKTARSAANAVSPRLAFIRVSPG